MTFAALAQPFIPHAAATIAKAVSGDTGSLQWPLEIADSLQPGASISVPDVLFAKIEPEQITDWSARFGGAG
jgi:methionyl-tRNA synthetase